MAGDDVIDQAADVIGSGKRGEKEARKLLVEAARYGVFMYHARGGRNEATDKVEKALVAFESSQREPPKKAHAREGE